jgi:hypothetical protein
VTGGPCAASTRHRWNPRPSNTLRPHSPLGCTRASTGPADGLSPVRACLPRRVVVLRFNSSPYFSVETGGRSCYKNSRCRPFPVRTPSTSCLARRRHCTLPPVDLAATGAPNHCLPALLEPRRAAPLLPRPRAHCSRAPGGCRPAAPRSPITSRTPTPTKNISLTLVSPTPSPSTIPAKGVAGAAQFQRAAPRLTPKGYIASSRLFPGRFL